MKDDNAQLEKKQPMRPHHIKEWAESQGFARPTDFAEALGADPSLISRWYSGAAPGVKWQERLASFFGIERESIFRHPDEVWVTEFLATRPAAEIDRIKIMLEAAFPKKPPKG